MSYRTTSLEGDPEIVAANLLEEPPGGRLDCIRLRNQQDLAIVIKDLFMRQGHASVERDEIIGFVKSNRAHIPMLLTTLDAFAEAGDNVEGGAVTGSYFSYLAESFRHAFEGRYDLINVRSDRLFWLIFALSAQLRSKKVGYAEVADHLARPATRARISAHQLQYMLMDYAESYGRPNQPETDMVAVIALAGRVGNLPREAAAALSLALKMGGFKNGEACARMLEDVYVHLQRVGQANPEDAPKLARLASRFGGVRDRRDF
jgi:hypothetical protein